MPSTRDADVSASSSATQARIAVALRVTFQCVAWIGAEAGTFRRHGIEATFPTLEAGGPGAVAGLANGEWDFCYTGEVPIVRGVLQGWDPVLILTPCDIHDGVFVMTQREITRPEQLAGARIGAVDATGQLGRAMHSLLQRWDVAADVVSLGSFETVYSALGARQLEAAYLPVDMRFRGEHEFGWNVLHALPGGIGGIATTRRLIATKRQFVGEFVKGCIEAIHLFKTRPDVAVPLLQRFLQLDDRGTIEQLYAFYVPLFRANPRPIISSEMKLFRDIFSNQYPAVEALQPQELYDASLVDQFDSTGFGRGLVGEHE